MHRNTQPNGETGAGEGSSCPQEAAAENAAGESTIQSPEITLNECEGIGNRESKGSVSRMSESGSAIGAAAWVQRFASINIKQKA